MDKREEKIKKLFEKKTKISIKECEKASKEIYELYKETNDAKLVVKYLFDGTYKVASKFIEDNYMKLGEEHQQEIISEIINELSIKEDKLSKCMSGFRIVTALINLNRKEEILEILDMTLELAESGSGFTVNVCKAFKDHLLDEVAAKTLTVNYTSWDKIQKQRLFRFIKKTEEDIGGVPYVKELNAWIDKYTEKVNKEMGIEEKEPKLIKEIKQADKLIEKLQSATKETEKLLDTVFNRNNTLYNLETRLKAREVEILSLKKEMENKEIKNNVLKLNVEKLENYEEVKDLKIKDLDNRLRECFQGNEISRNQEIITLKKNIANAVKLQYEDFVENKDAECNEDNYALLKVNLNNIFRTLNMYGIEL